MSDRLVFLDFDGVLCDSLSECLVSSWEAYYGLLRHRIPDRVPSDLRAAFSQMRPYVRSGEDYVLLQELLEAGTAARSQEDFDSQIRARGPRLMREYGNLMYRARSELLRTERGYWIGLNRIYPFLLPALRAWVRSPRLHILSTKKAAYILEILTGKGVGMDPTRVLHCGAHDKPRVIARIMRGKHCGRALWVDDQLDQLRSPGEEPRGTELRRCLASWGYVRPEWLSHDLGLEVLTPSRLIETLEHWLSSPPGRAPAECGRDPAG